MDEDTTILLNQCGDAVNDPDSATDEVLCVGNVSSAPPPAGVCSLVVRASLVAAAGGLLFGYDLGVISGALLVMQRQLSLSCRESEAVVSVMMVGALLASLIGGWVVDRIGRKYAIIMNAALFAIGAVTLATANSFLIILLGRLLVGFAVSLSAVSECVYISEIAPACRRGELVSLNELAITVGFLLSYLADHLLITRSDGWRYMFGLALIPAVLQAVGMFFLPRTPHFLLLQKKERQAEVVLQRLSASTDVKQQLALVRLAVSDVDGSSSERRLCGVLSWSGDGNALWPSLVIAVVLVVSQQACGQPTLLGYAPAVLRLVGYCADSAATMATVGMGVVKVLATSLTLFYVDRVGRRKLLLAGTVLMFLCLLTMSVVTYSGQPHDLSPGEALCSGPSPPDLHSMVGSTEDSVEPLPTPLSLVTSSNGSGRAPPRGKASAVEYYQLTVTGAGVGEEQTSTITESGAGNNQGSATTDPAVQTGLGSTSTITESGAGNNQGSATTDPAAQIGLGSTESTVDDYGGSATSRTSVNDQEDGGKSTGPSEATAESDVLPCAGSSGWRPLVALLSLMGIVAGYSVGFGPITWLVLSEIFPPAVKGRALALSTALNWLANLLMSATFLQAVDVLSLCGVFSVYGIVCFLACFFIFFAVPETSNKALHEISAELCPSRWLHSCRWIRSRGNGRSKSGDYRQINQFSL